MTAKDKISGPVFPLCTSKARFASMCLRQDLSTLTERVLYSSLPNGLLYDCMLVCHKERTVYVFQSSSLRGKDHPLTYSGLKGVMDGLGFDKNPDYKMVYVYCSDGNSESETGCVIMNYGNAEVSAADVEFVESRVTILTAGVCYYPNTA